MSFRGSRTVHLEQPPLTTANKAHNRWNYAGREREVRIGIGGDIASAICGRLLEHVVHAAQDHQASAWARRGKKPSVVHRDLHIGVALDD